MATPEELVARYDKDPDLRKEVDEILADGKISMKEFITFAKKHQLNVTLSDLPRVISEAKKRGFIN